MNSLILQYYAFGNETIVIWEGTNRGELLEEYEPEGQEGIDYTIYECDIPNVSSLPCSRDLTSS